MNNNLNVTLKKIVEINNKSNRYSIKELMITILKLSVELTNSKCAIIHLINRNQSIITPEMCVDQFGKVVETSDQTNSISIGQKGIWADCIKNNKSVIQNNCELIDQNKFSPSLGKVSRIILMPICEDEKVVTILGICNKENIYEESDLEILHLISISLWNIIKKKREEEKRFFSEDIFNKVIQNGPLLMSVSEIETGKYIEVNDKFLSVLGYRREEVIGQTSIKLGLINCETRQQIKNTLLSEGKIERIEIDFKKKNGEKITCLYFGVIIDVYQSPKFLTIAEDITELKKINIKLLESEEKFRSVFEYANSGIAIGNKEGKFLDLNEKFENISGYNKSELLKMNFADLTCPEDLKTELIYVEEILKGERDHYRLHKRYNTKSGQKKWIDLSVTTIRNENKEVESFVGIVNDIDAEKKSRQALKESEEKYRLLYENAGVGICYFDIKGNVISFNNQAASHLNVSPAQVVGKNIYDIFSNEDAKKYQKRFKETIESDSSKIYKDVFISAGEEIWFLSTLNKVTDNKNNVIGIQIISKDITDLKLAEKKIIESEEKFRLLFENQVDGFAYHKIITDEKNNPIDYEYININKGFEKHTGKPASEVIGKTVLELWPDMEKYWIEKFGKVALSGEPTSFENYAQSLGRFYQVNAYSPKKGFFAVSFADITERVLADKALKESEEKYKELVEKAGISIAVDNKEGELIYMNEQFARMFGYTIEEMRKIKRLGFVHNEYRNFIKENHTNQISGKKAKGNYIFKGTTKNKHTIWVEVYTTPIKNQNELVGTRNYCFDITERVKTDEELKTHRENLEHLVLQRTKQLEEVNVELECEIARTKTAEKKLKESLIKEKELGELKSRFISTASHEFRTPLTTILSSTELLDMLIQNKKFEKVDNHFGRIRRSIEYLTSLIDDILILNKQETGVMSFNPSLIDIEQNAEQIFNDIDLSTDDNYTLLFNSSIRKDAKHFIDPKLFKLICTNLLSNAIKYSPEGGEVKMILSEGNEKIKLTVTDQGIGISENDQKLIFNHFERGENIQNIPGSGLGLSIVKRSVELHGGTIVMNSKIGEGSQFNIELPVIKGIHEKYNDN